MVEFQGKTNGFDCMYIDVHKGKTACFVDCLQSLTLRAQKVPIMGFLETAPKKWSRIHRQIHLIHQSLRIRRIRR
jgi:hypothetical protein